MVVDEHGAWEWVQIHVQAGGGLAVLPSALTGTAAVTARHAAVQHQPALTVTGRQQPRAPGAPGRGLCSRDPAAWCARHGTVPRARAQAS